MYELQRQQKQGLGLEAGRAELSTLGFILKDDILVY